MFSISHNFTSALFIGFSIDLLNRTLFLNLVFCLLILLSFFLLLFANLYCVRYMVLKNCSLFNSNTIRIFIIVNLNVSKFYVLIEELVFTFIAYIRWGFLLLHREALLSSLICNWYSNNIFSVTFTFSWALWWSLCKSSNLSG